MTEIELNNLLGKIGKSRCTVIGNQLSGKGSCAVKARKETDQAYNAAVSAVVSVKTK